MEPLLKEVVENSPAGVFIAFNGLIRFLNSRFSEIFGYPENTLAGKDLLGLFEAGCRGNFTGKGRRGFRCSGIRRDGSLVPLEVRVTDAGGDGVPVLAGSVLDLTDLSESEARFRKLVTESPFPALIHDEDGKVLLVSKSWTEISGYSIEDIPTSYAFNSKALGMNEGLNKEHMEEVYRLGRIDEGEYRIKTKNGETRTWVFSTVSLGKGDGKKIFLCLAMDVTERVRAEEERSGMFHMLTHDLKGPLTIISGYGDLIEKQGDRATAEMAGEIVKAGRRISALIDNMLALSRMEAAAAPVTLAPVLIREVMEEALQETRATAEKKGLTVTLEVEEGLGVQGDRVQLARAAGNLLANAVKYNKWGGRVAVKAGTPSAWPDQYFIEVADTGVGIPKEHQPHVFEKFYRCPHTGAIKGTGLGLAIVKAAAEAHGGHVSLSSVPGQGSVFTMTMPKRPQAGEAKKAA